MFRNEEFKSMILKLVLLQIIFAVVGFFVVSIFMDNINQKIIKRDMALVGNIIKNHPELKEEMIPYITKEISKEDKKNGEEILKSYGYHKKLNKSFQPILKRISPNLQIFIFLLIFFFTIPLGYMIKGEYKKIYKKIQDIYTASEKVVEGDFGVYLTEEGEGDFNILNHQFNQMANRLENSLSMLNREKVFLKNMISDISHQLKTPLSSLIVINDILLEDENMDLNIRQNFLETERSQLERMEWLTINLLKVARIEAGAIEFKKEKVLLRDILNIALSALNHRLENKTLEIDGDENAIFYGDKEWTGEALINIIKNAIEHGRGKINIRLEETPLFSSIIVKDNGEGIDEKHLPHIFDRFYKVSSEVKLESIGIGLNLAKLIVESQDGTISVKSKKFEGTEFTITFLKGTI
ncbi:HAMP domain-containing sensor histidine kinase [Tissierella praeacuta]|uniref:HAMP domain-containing sensor histidine kinase n=1 Tax=Tissierella praeacuta TaxID=43131 RepID=UPI000ECC5A3E|nr:HAMP domain-containing sensor histidine kinase [Tissierella praeacuta]MBU5255880.1 HAMP domain-containing histidine kinase [Tissierella praeacuta]HAE92411.1 sensor histidine kinase [Tissierella sp.]